MSKLTYAQFVDPEVILLKLRGLEIKEEEFPEILNLVDEIFRIRLLSLILSELEEGDKIHFLKLVDLDSGVEVVDFVKTKVVNIEDKIQIIVQEVHNQVLEDISDLEF